MSLVKNASQAPCRLLSFPGSAPAIFPLCTGARRDTREERERRKVLFSLSPTILRAPFCSSPCLPPSFRPKEKRGLGTWLVKCNCYYNDGSEQLQLVQLRLLVGLRFKQFSQNLASFLSDPLAGTNKSELSKELEKTPLLFAQCFDFILG